MATAQSHSFVPHARGCNLVWRGPALGGHAAQRPARGQRHRPPGLTTRQKCLQTSLGQVSPAGSLCPPQPLGAVPLPLFGTQGSPGRDESDPMLDQRPQGRCDPRSRSPHRDSQLPQGPRAHHAASRMKAQATEHDTQACTMSDDRPPRGSQKGLMCPPNSLTDSAWSRALTTTRP